MQFSNFGTVIIFGLIIMNLWLWNKLYILEQTVNRHQKILETEEN